MRMYSQYSGFVIVLNGDITVCIIDELCGSAVLLNNSKVMDAVNAGHLLSGIEFGTTYNHNPNIRTSHRIRPAYCREQPIQYHVLHAREPLGGLFLHTRPYVASSVTSHPVSDPYRDGALLQSCLMSHFRLTSAHGRENLQPV
jgi:hypothetical protein